MPFRTPEFKGFLNFTATLPAEAVDETKRLIIQVLRDPTYGVNLGEMDLGTSAWQLEIQMYLADIAKILPGVHCAWTEAQVDDLQYRILVTFIRGHFHSCHCMFAGQNPLGPWTALRSRLPDLKSWLPIDLWANHLTTKGR